MRCAVLGNKGQFYIVAAMVIVSVISGLAFIIGHFSERDSTLVHNSKKSLEIESENVLEYGIIQKKDISSLIDDFTKNFTDYAGRNTKIYFITGKKEAPEVYTYENGIKKQISYINNGDTVSFLIDEIPYNFTLLDGENFHFVMIQKERDNQYVATS